MLNNQYFHLYENLYSEKKIEKILSDSSFVKKLLFIELMLNKTNYKLGIISKKAYININNAINSTKFNKIELQENLEYSGVITLNIIDKIRKKINKPYKGFLHYGVTSQDVIDTANVLLLKEVKKLFLKSLKKICIKLYKIAKENKKTFTLGRTRNTHATLTTFGLKVTYWLLPIIRHLERLEATYRNGLLSIQLGGPVGNMEPFKKKGISFKKIFSNYLNLDFNYYSWHNQRDNIIDFSNTLCMITGSIGKISEDLLTLSQSEIQEIKFTKTGTSSSMPHKNNPILAELLVSLAKLNSKQHLAMHDTIFHKNERDGIAWFIEWKALTNILRFTSASLEKFYKCLALLKINKKAMQNNIKNTYGTVLSNYYFNNLLKYYDYDELKKKFPTLINRAFLEKKHFAEILNQELNCKLKFKKNEDLSNFIGLNDKIINSMEKKIKSFF